MVKSYCSISVPKISYKENIANSYQLNYLVFLLEFLVAMLVASNLERSKHPENAEFLISHTNRPYFEPKHGPD